MPLARPGALVLKRDEPHQRAPLCPPNYSSEQRDSAAVKGISDISVVKIDCNKARPDEPSVLSKVLRILTPSEAIGDGDGDKELISLQALPRLSSFTVVRGGDPQFLGLVVIAPPAPLSHCQTYCALSLL